MEVFLGHRGEGEGHNVGLTGFLAQASSRLTDAAQTTSCKDCKSELHAIKFSLEMSV